MLLRGPGARAWQLCRKPGLSTPCATYRTPDTHYWPPRCHGTPATRYRTSATTATRLVTSGSRNPPYRTCRTSARQTVTSRSLETRLLYSGSPAFQLSASRNPASQLSAYGSSASLLSASGSPASQLSASGSPASQLSATRSPASQLSASRNPTSQLSASGSPTFQLLASGSPATHLSAYGTPLVRFSSPGRRWYSSAPSSRTAQQPDPQQDQEPGKGDKLGKNPDGQDLRRLLELAQPERWRLSAAVGFLTVSSVITMSAPFFLGKVIDVIYSNPSEAFASNLSSLCALLGGVFLVGAAANGARVYLMQTSGQRIVRRLRSSLFSSLLKQEVGFFDKTRTGELINRLSSDSVLIGRSVTENLSDGLRAVAQATVGVGMMFFVSPQLSTFVLSVIPPLAVVGVIYGRYLRKVSKLTQDSLAEATQLAEERMGNLRTVRAFGKEQHEMQRYDRKVDYVLDLAYKEALARAGFFGMTGLSGNLIVLAVLYKGGLLTGAAHMTVGELSSFLMYAFWVGISIGGLSSFYSELMKGFGAGTRIWQLLDRKPEMAFNEGEVIPPEKFHGALEFRDVTFRYPTRPEAPIFQSLNLSVPSGSVMAVVGPSGSGKSTLVSLLLRLYDPNAGSVHLDGQDVRQLNPLWLRSKIGTVSQEPVLFSCSIAENIAYGADDPSSVTREDIRRVAEIANARSFVENFPMGFDTVVGEKGILLSGGQKQRIAIARALLKNPRILLLDEATSALDAENEFLVQEALDRLMEGRTVLIIAHRLSTIQNADAVAVIDQGRVVECGKHEQLLRNPDGLFSKLMEKQASLIRSRDAILTAQ